jgi:hypothetical protein
MSRLDSFIRRMQAQRACLDTAASLIKNVPGPILELGLGNGRTYDHLRSILPGRRIYVFEREVRAHPNCTPDDEDLFLGDFRDTLPGAAQRIGVKAAMVHADIGTGEAASTASIASFVAQHLAPMLAPGGVIVSDQPIHGEGWETLPLPDGVNNGRYFLKRVHG